MLKRVFWQRAAQSLPLAEHIESVVAAVVDFWRRFERRMHAQASR